MKWKLGLYRGYMGDIVAFQRLEARLILERGFGGKRRNSKSSDEVSWPK